MRRHKFAAAVLLPGAAAGILAVSAAIAQVSGVWDLQWNAISAGGGVSTGDPYAVSGTLGQPLAGTSSGPSYEVTSGFAAGLGEIKFRSFVPFISRE